MYGRLRIDVAERQRLVVLVDDVRGDLALDDLLEDVVAHHDGRSSGGPVLTPTRSASEGSPRWRFGLMSGGAAAARIGPVARWSNRTDGTASCPGSSVL